MFIRRKSNHFSGGETFSENLSEVICKESNLADDSKVGIEKLWKYTDVANFLDVSIRSVKRLVSSDRIPYSRVGTSIRFCPWALREWSQKGGSR